MAAKKEINYMTDIDHQVNVEDEGITNQHVVCAPIALVPYCLMPYTRANFSIKGTLLSFHCRLKNIISLLFSLLLSCIGWSHYH